MEPVRQPLGDAINRLRGNDQRAMARRECREADQISLGIDHRAAVRSAIESKVEQILRSIKPLAQLRQLPPHSLTIPEAASSPLPVRPTATAR